MVLEKTLESPLDHEEIKPVNPKESNPEYSLEGLVLKLKLQSFGCLMQRANSLEKTLLLGKIREGNGTPLQYSTWKIPQVEEPGRLQSMGSLRVGHN